MNGHVSKTWVLGVLACASALFAIALAWNLSLRDDDLAYLMWSHSQPFGPGILDGPFSAFRPLNDLTWWMLGQLSPSGRGLLVVEGALWGATALGLAHIGWQAKQVRGALLGASWLLCSATFVDLLAWRSWLTTTGALFGLSFALASRQHTRWVWLFSLLGGGFKETATWAMGAYGLAHRRWALVPLLAVAVAAGSGAVSKLSSPQPANLEFVAETFGQQVYSVPLLGFVAGGPALALACTAVAPFAPSMLAGGLVLTLSAVALLRQRAFLVVVGLSLLPLLFASWSARQYVLEPWLLVGAGVLTTDRFASVPWWVLPAMLLLAAPQQLDHARGRGQRSPSFAEQLRIIEEQTTSPNALLVIPSEGWEAQVDVLPWTFQGGVWVREPPAGTTPTRSTPLSGLQIVEREGG